MKTEASPVFGKASLHKESRVNALLIAFMIILAVSLILKVFVWIFFLLPNTDLIMSNDSFSYENSAQALLKTGNFAVSPELSNVPQTIRTPGYPVFLASVYTIFGNQSSAAIFVQIFVSIGTIVFVFFIARSIWDPQTGLVACLLVALDVVSFAHAVMLLTETLFTFLVVAFLSVSIYQLGKKERFVWTFLLMGSCLGLATLVRPISYYLIIPVGIGFAIWMTMQQWDLKTILLRVAILVLPFVLIVGGWQLRNYSLTGSSQFSQISGVNMLFYRATGVVMVRDGLSKEEARHQLTGADKASQVDRATMHPAEKLGETWQRQGLSIVLSHPLLYARSAIPGALSMMFAPGDGLLSQILGLTSDSNTGPLGDLLRLSIDQYIEMWVVQQTGSFLLFLLASIYIIIIYTGMFWWTFSRSQVKVKLNTTVHLFLLGVLFYFLIVSAGFEANPRFRVVIMPILALYSAKGLNNAFFAIRTGYNAYVKKPLIKGVTRKSP